MAKDKIESLDDLIGLVHKIKEGDIHPHVRWWWRGQADKDWKLHPGVYRPNFPAKKEWERILLENLLAQDFQVESAGLIEGSHEHDKLYFLEQHYGLPTRLLDWTTNPLAALFFACSEHEKVDGEKADGALFFMDAYQLAVTQNTKDKNYQGVVTMRHQAFQKALKTICDWARKPPSGFPDFIMALRPDYSDLRIVLQRSCFTFHVPGREELTLAHNKSLKKYTIPSGAKKTLLHELIVLGVDEFSIYGDLDHLGSRLKRAHKIPNS
jgi:FRG domain-containing protein